MVIKKLGVEIAEINIIKIIKEHGRNLIGTKKQYQEL